MSLSPLAGPAAELAFVNAVLAHYLQLPDTPLRAGLADQRLARQLLERGVSLTLVEAAMLLGSLRRLIRPVDLPPLQPIRSLAYFMPLIDELLAQPLPDGYIDYLRLKLARVQSAIVRKTYVFRGSITSSPARLGYVPQNKSSTVCFQQTAGLRTRQLGRRL